MTKIISTIDNIWIDFTAASADVIIFVEAVELLIWFVKSGTNIATPNGIVKSLNKPYVPVAAPALSSERFDNTTFINIEAFPPSPNPNIPNDNASNITEVSTEKNNIIAHPTKVKGNEIDNILLGSYLSVNGPKIIEPEDIPKYIIEIAYPDITVLSGFV